MRIKAKKIAIIGGGPGGLTLARLLQMNGADVTVYERDGNKNARVQGATLDLHAESGLAALERAGLMDAFKANYRPGADRILIMDAGANIVYDDHAQEAKGAFGDEHFRPEIDRGPLRNIMLASLREGTVVWDRNIRTLEPADDGWKVIFKNSSPVLADIVIGADGANSKVRPFVTPIIPFFAGITAVEGTIYESEKNCPVIHGLLKGGKIFAMGNDQTLIVSAKGDGSIAFYTGCKTNEHWVTGSGIDFKDKAQVLLWFRRQFSTWSPVWQELFERDGVYFTPRPQYCIPTDQAWAAQPNITLLGDAAHLMPPYAGEGVNMAMLDALELSECLLSNDHGNVQSAIAQYETRMRTRASATAQMTLEQTEMLHSEGALENMIGMFGL